MLSNGNYYRDIAIMDFWIRQVVEYDCEVPCRNMGALGGLSFTLALRIEESEAHRVPVRAEIADACPLNVLTLRPMSRPHGRKQRT